MKFNPENPYYSATIEVYVINNKDFQDFFIGYINYASDYDEGLLEMMSEDIKELIRETILEKLYQTPTDGTEYILQTDFQYHFWQDYWGEADIDVANRYQILSSKECDFDKEYNFYWGQIDTVRPEQNPTIT